MQVKTPAAFSVKDMATEMIAATKAFVSRALKPFEDRIAELERRAPVPGPSGENGKSITVEDVTPLLEAEVAKWEVYFERRANDKLQKAIDRIQIPRDGEQGDRGEKGSDGAAGKDAPPVDYARIVADVLKLVPVPKDGETGQPGKDAPAVNHAQIVADVLKLVPTPKDGTDGKDAPIIDEAKIVQAVAKLIPVPKDGNDGAAGKDADPIDTDAVIAAVLKQIPAPKDGAAGKDADQAAILDAVMQKAVQAIEAFPMPTDGTNGADGASVNLDDVRPMLEAEVAKWALDFERRAASVLERAVDRMPKPKDGANGDAGRDGVDGFGFDDFDVEYDGKRAFTFKWKQGEREKVKSFTAPIILYQGVYQKSGKYSCGDSVTYGGSLFIAMQEEPDVQPGDGKAWKLAVKNGGRGS